MNAQTLKRAIILNFNNLLLFMISDSARFSFYGMNIFVIDVYKESANDKGNAADI